jgi:hypothetical protein
MSIKKEPEISQSLSLPSNHMEVEGELCKLFYQKFGQEALPIIKAVFHEWGIAIGERMRAKMPEVDFKTAIEAYLKPVLDREPKPEIIESSDKRFEGKFFICPYRLNGAGRPLCEAMTTMETAVLETLTGEGVENRLLKTVAAPGDEYCHGVFTRKTP